MITENYIDHNVNYNTLSIPFLSYHNFKRI